jgi:hypothetical protein
VAHRRSGSAPKAENTLLMAPKFASTFFAFADQPAFGLSGERSLADNTPRPIEGVEAAGAAEGIAQVGGRRPELEPTARVAAAVADLMGAGRGVR